MSCRTCSFAPQGRAPHITHRLAGNRRAGGKARQRILLSPGRRSAVGRESRPPLCRRVKEPIPGQQGPGFEPLDPETGAGARRVAARLPADGADASGARRLRSAGAAGELAGIDPSTVNGMALHRASGRFLPHRDRSGDRLSGAARTLFGLAPAVTLYDHTDTCFEGAAGQWH